MTTGARPTRLLVIGAHPDDAEFQAGGLMVLAARAGAQVGILCVTDGSAGHATLSREALAARRADEAQAAAQLVGAELILLGEPDGELMPTLEVRLRLIAAIRRFRPDVIVTHRSSDFHPDHRATAVLAQDACFLARVPNVVPDVPVLGHEPVLLNAHDFARRPVPFDPDWVLPIDDVVDDVVELLACHASQVFDWLPQTFGLTVEGDPVQWLRDFYGTRPAAIARRHASSGTRFAEAFEISGHGRRLPAERVHALLLGARGPGVPD
jgi:N-acetylglucosamine malate deacetylase 1